LTDKGQSYEEKGIKQWKIFSLLKKFLMKAVFLFYHSFKFSSFGLAE
jgi:hypothetical protein